MRLGKRLKQAREKRGLTQEQLAQAASTPDLAISQGAISALEQRDSETTVFLFAVARVLKINPEWLQTGHGDSGLEADAWRPAGELVKDEEALLADYRAASDAWKLTTRLFVKAEPEEQPQLSRDVNNLLGHVFDRAGTPDSRVKDTLVSSRHGFPPGSNSANQDEPPSYERNKK